MSEIEKCQLKKPEKIFYMDLLKYVLDVKWLMYCF